MNIGSAHSLLKSALVLSNEALTPSCFRCCSDTQSHNKKGQSVHHVHPECCSMRQTQSKQPESARHPSAALPSLTDQWRTHTSTYTQTSTDSPSSGTCTHS
jgi:hypothetical protein